MRIRRLLMEDPDALEKLCSKMASIYRGCYEKLRLEGQSPAGGGWAAWVKWVTKSEEFSMFFWVPRLGDRQHFEKCRRHVMASLTCIIGFDVVRNIGCWLMMSGTNNDPRKSGTMSLVDSRRRELENSRVESRAQQYWSLLSEKELRREVWQLDGSRGISPVDLLFQKGQIMLQTYKRDQMRPAQQWFWGCLGSIGRNTVACGHLDFFWDFYESSDVWI